jgi:hypothetical protein
VEPVNATVTLNLDSDDHPVTAWAFGDPQSGSRWAELRAYPGGAMLCIGLHSKDPAKILAAIDALRQKVVEAWCSTPTSQPADEDDGCGPHTYRVVDIYGDDDGAVVEVAG